MTYSTVDDLLTGDLLISQKVDKQKFVQDAADEMDSKLGFLYELPLAPCVTDPPPAVPATLEPHEILLLKGINNKLASGRLILTLDIAGEETVLHAYGLRLITEAMNDLMLVANGNVLLSACRQEMVAGLRSNRTPLCVNRDEESAQDMFESAVMRRGETAVWQPGEAADEALYADSYSPNSGTLYGG